MNQMLDVLYVALQMNKLATFLVASLAVGRLLGGVYNKTYGNLLFCWSMFLGQQSLKKGLDYRELSMIDSWTVDREGSVMIMSYRQLSITHRQPFELTLATNSQLHCITTHIATRSRCSGRRETSI